MFAFGLCPPCSGGTPVLSPNRLFLVCGCGSFAGIMGFAAVTAEMQVSGFCQCFPGNHQVSVLLSKVSCEKTDQKHMVTPVQNSLGLLLTGL